MKKAILLLCSISCLGLFGQAYNFDKVIPELSIPNPDASGLGKYGNIPMSLYTGTANISVPLYSLSFDGLNIPLELSYNTSGIRYDQEASWVGLGWVLSCEPIITRQVNGHCDISKTQYSEGKIGYIYTNQELPQYGNGVELAKSLREKLYEYTNPHISFHGWDTEPDIFTANVFGEIISFVLIQKYLNNGEAVAKVLSNDKQYKVEYLEENKTFILTNGDGFRFFFEKKEESLTAPYCEADEQGHEAGYRIPREFIEPIISSWKITKIISPKSKVLEYEYEDEVSLIQSHPKVDSKFTTSVKEKDIIYSEATQGNNLSSYISLNRTHYLKTIKFPGGTIHFNLSDRSDLQCIYTRGNLYTISLTDTGMGGKLSPKKMDKLEIKNLLGETLINYKFEYSYFGKNTQSDSDSNRSDKLRLKLDTIIHNNQLYRSFSYIEPENLPAKSDRRDDFWGFNTNRDNVFNQNQIGHHPTFRGDIKSEEKMNIPGVNRSPNIQISLIGMLNKVYYPTGGYTQIYYESHDIQVTPQNITDFKKYGYNFPNEKTQVESITEHPSESEVFEITEDTYDVVDLTISFGFGGNGYNSKDFHQEHVKYTVEFADRTQTALEIVDVNNNTIVARGMFTDDVFSDDYGLGYDYMGNKQTAENWNIKYKSFKLPKGKYKVRTKGLHVAYCWDKRYGVSESHPDYGKVYTVAVHVKIDKPLPKSFKLPIGGPRILYTKNYDSDHHLISGKKYEYINDDNTSSGILIAKLAFVGLHSEFYERRTELPPFGNIFKEERDYVMASSHSNSVHSSPSSSHIGYAQVRESNITYEKTNGYKVSNFKATPNEYISRDQVLFLSSSGNIIPYRIRSIDDPLDKTLTNYSTSEISPSPSFYFPYPTKSDEASNGQLIREKYFNSNNKKVKEISYEYDNREHMHNISHSLRVISGLKPILKFNNKYISIPEHILSATPHWAISGFQVYNILSIGSPLRSQTETTYLNDTISEIISYQYNENFLPSNISRVTSKEDQNSIVNYTYATDSINIEQDEFMEDLISSNIIKKVITEEHNLANSKLFKRYNKVRRIKLKNDFNQFVNCIVNDKGYFKIGSSEIDKDDLVISYDIYDTKGNLLQYTANDSLPISYLWSYNYQYPIAEIRNAKLEDITAALQKQGKTIDGLANMIMPNWDVDKFRNDLSSALITTYTYKPLVGMLTSTDPSGKTTFYEYDAFNRLQRTYIKDEDNKEQDIENYEYHYRNK